MRKGMKLVLSLVMVLALIVGTFGLQKSKASAEETVGYKFENGTLNILTKAGLTEWEEDETFAAEDVKEVIISENINEIDKSVFNSVESIESIIFEGNIACKFGTPFSYLANLKELVFKGDCDLESGSFMNDPNIETLIFEGAVHIDGGAFSSSAMQITELYFPKTAYISSGKFCRCSKLKKITFEGDATCISGCFQYNEVLETVLFKGKSDISGGCFSDCVNISSIDFKGSTKIWAGAFSCYQEAGNSKLTKLYIPAGSVFGEITFENCTSLAEVTFGENTKILGNRQFINCLSLNTLIFEDVTPQEFESLTFTNLDPAKLTIYVPTEEAVEAYKEKFAKDTAPATEDEDDSESVKHYNAEFVDRIKVKPQSAPVSDDNGDNGNGGNNTAPSDYVPVVLPPADTKEESAVVDVTETETPEAEPETAEPETVEPETTETVETAEADEAEEVEVAEAETPQAELPKTGAVSMGILYAISAACILAGGSLTYKARRKEEE